MLFHLAKKPVLAVLLALTLAACAPSPKVDMAPKDLGDFRLGFDIVVANKMKQVPPSRKATPEEWKAAMKAQIEQRFRKYQGSRLYHIAISIDAYSLAIPGIPLIFTPKSILVFTVNIWDDAKQAKLNKKPKQITVFEALTPGSLVGTGYTETRKQQMASLARSAGRQIENWMVRNPDWFIHPDLAAPDTPAKDTTAVTPPKTAPAPPVPVPAN